MPGFFLVVVLVCLVFAVQLNQINGAKADKKTDQAVQHRQWSGVEVTAGEKKGRQSRKEGETKLNQINSINQSKKETDRQTEAVAVKLVVVVMESTVVESTVSVR